MWKVYVKQLSILIFISRYTLCLHLYIYTFIERKILFLENERIFTLFFQDIGRLLKQIRNAWKVIKCGAGERWRRSVGPIV